RLSRAMTELRDERARTTTTTTESDADVPRPCAPVWSITIANATDSTFVGRRIAVPSGAEAILGRRSELFGAGSDPSRCGSWRRLRRSIESSVSRARGIHRRELCCVGGRYVAAAPGRSSSTGRLCVSYSLARFG